MSKSISEIKIEFEQAGEQQWEALCQEYETDSRTGVKNLTARYRKKQQALVQERERLEVMKTFERKYADYSFICGIDEVGRGPLAGPVVAGAVILPKECEILYINDSKKLSAAKRDELYDEIMDKAVAVGLGMASPVSRSMPASKESVPRRLYSASRYTSPCSGVGRKSGAVLEIA